MLDLDVTTVPATSRVGRARALVLRHPLATVAVVAAVLRVAFAIVSFVVHRHQFIPDEGEYIALARLVASGGSADDLVKGYSQTFYDATWPFTGVLAALFRYTVASRIVAQLYVVVFGTLTAVLTARLARRVVGPVAALGAGLVVAAVPSQVMWSSVVLREALVWAALAALALLVVRAGEVVGWRFVAVVAAAAAVLFALTHLRSQTAVIGAWALLVAAWVAPGRTLLRGSVLTVVALVVPLLGGLGLGGVDLASSAAPNLARTRTYLGFDSDSALVTRQTQASGDIATDCSREPVPEHDPSDIGAEAIAGARTERHGDTNIVCDRSGRAIVVDDGLSANVRYLPKGLAAVLLRPFPWERARNAQIQLAALENVAWYALYLLAIAGVLLAGWTRLRILAFPLLAGAFTIGSSALTQGNLGTAFRHRAQVLWVLALFGAVAVETLTERRRARRA